MGTTQPQSASYKHVDILICATKEINITYPAAQKAHQLIARTLWRLVRLARSMNIPRINGTPSLHALGDSLRTPKQALV